MAVFPAASFTVYVTVVTPLLNKRVPAKLIPVVAEAPVVAPDKVQVNSVAAQLSAIVGFGVTTVAAQIPGSVFA